MENISYKIKNEENIITPALLYYKEIIIENTKKAIEIAGGAERLWPHVKSHKMMNMVKLQMSLGISRFKCATIAEAEMLADCGVKDILLAYPLVGPNIERLIKLEKKYPNLTFWAIEDDIEQAKKLGKCSKENNLVTKVLVDMNLGTNRTGVPIRKAAEFYENCMKIEGIDVLGFHCYDGHQGAYYDIADRQKSVDEVALKIKNVKDTIESKGMECSVFIMGGTPSFPCHAKYKNTFLSPGTLFITDYGYYSRYKDMNFVPGAAIITRVISNPEDGYFTLDLGYKGIASDPEGARGKVVGLENAMSVGQNEEHWIFKMNEGHYEETPKVGDVLYVIPTHICPTSALYPEAIIIEGGEVVENWDVTARNRKITI
jgi:D-serine deaminase-like pyridoxal phosphate-dependent protein